MLKFREVHIYYALDGEGNYDEIRRKPGRIFELEDWPNGFWVDTYHEVEHELIE